jgi:branched-chain amino acid transport system permease protein
MLITHVLIVGVIYAMLAVSLNPILGTTGLFNMGHHAFFGIGAYVAALLSLAGAPFLVSTLAGGIGAAVVAFVIGLPTLTLSADTLAVVTLGFGEIARAIFNNWLSLTKGPMGLIGIPGPTVLGFAFDTPARFLGLSVVFLGVVLFLTERLVRCPFGRVLRGIREDETATVCLGKNTFWFKMWVFAWGAAMAGIAGSLYAHYIGYIDPSSFTLWLTFFMILILMLGGLGNNLGAVVASLFFVGAREGLRFLGLPTSIAAPLQQIIFGILLLAVTIARPRGLIPERRFLSRQVRYAEDSESD